MNDDARAARHSGTDTPSAMAQHDNWRAEARAILYGDLNRILAAKLRQRLGKSKPRHLSCGKNDRDDWQTFGSESILASWMRFCVLPHLA